MLTFELVVIYLELEYFQNILVQTSKMQYVCNIRIIGQYLARKQLNHFSKDKNLFSK